MSTRRGANNRDRPQKHKNRVAFKNDLHDKTPQIKFLNNLNVAEVCEHCKAVIEWKIKYKKYKPLSQPKTCTKCGQRNVRKAYHVNCTECALKLRCCAKCNKSADDVHILPPAPTPQEQMKLDSEMQLLLKTLPERKRRSFLRYMKKGKKKEKAEGEEDDDIPEGDEEDEDDSGSDLDDKEGEEAGDGEEKPKDEKIPYTKEELLKKLEQLKLTLANVEAGEDCDEDDDFFGSDFDDEDDDDDSFDEEKEEDEEEEKKSVKIPEKVKGVSFAKGVKK